MFKSKEAITRSICVGTLTDIFKGKYDEGLKALTTGETFDKWVDCVSKRMSELADQGMNNENLLVFAQDATKEFASSYLQALSSAATKSLDKNT